MTYISRSATAAGRLVLRSEVPHLPTRQIVGFPLVDATMEDAVEWLYGRMLTATRTQVAFVNAHCANVAAADPDYRVAMMRKDFILPDGAGVAVAARMQGVRLTANLNGSDLTPLLCARMGHDGRSVFLLGGLPGVAAAAAEALRRDCPGLVVAGTHHGYFGPDEEDAVLARVNASGADLLLVAMGVPAQDTWLDRVSHRLAPALSMGVGGLFDYLSRRIPRAPRALRLARLEWTWRLYQEPGRMWRRYLLGNAAFLARAARDAAPGWQRSAAAWMGEVVRRVLDVAVATVALISSLPMLLLLGALVRLTSAGPAIHRQTRIGRHGKPFTMYKLRSMYIDAEERRSALAAHNHHGVSDVTFKLRRDPRVTPLGRLLRRSSLDEALQLLNVLRGDMSLVGPRPQLPGEVARYTPEQRRRLIVRPGLTGLWQISGRADLSFARQVELDVEYLRTRSLITDLRILLQTVPAVLFARGAY